MIERRSFGSILTAARTPVRIAVVDVLVHAQVGLHGVDEAGERGVVRRDAQRGLVARAAR